MKRLLALLVLAVLCACSGAHESETIGSTSSALDLPAATPLPANAQGVPIWDGTAADLAVADAWAGCSYRTSSYLSVAEPIALDRYMQHVLQTMGSATCAAYANEPPLRRWARQRQDSTCNVTPDGGVNQAAKIDVVQLLGIVSPQFTQEFDGDRIIRDPQVDLCIAQRLRALAPGAASGMTLTLSAADQRQLLIITEERAKMALLGFLSLASVVNTPIPSYNQGTGIYEAQRWIRNASLNEQEELSDDFAAAAQLLSVTTEDALALISRSASAKVPRSAASSATAPTAAEEQWGAGSWRERAFRLLYRGDPLSGDVPWPHVDGPGGLPFGPPDSRFSFDVTRFVSTDVRAPQPSTLEQLARQFDILDLKTSPPTPYCSFVAVEPAANRLYRAVEAKLRTADCVIYQGGLCGTVQPETLPDPATSYDDFLLWTRYRIAFDDARVLVKLLRDELPVPCTGDAQIYELPGALHLFGASSLVTLQGVDAGTYLHIDKDARLGTRDNLAEHEGAYRGGTYTPRATVVPYADTDGQGFPIDPTIRDQLRELGTVPVLVATREVLTLVNQQPLITIDPSDTDGDAFRTRYLSRAASILGIVRGSIGDETFSIYVPTSKFGLGFGPYGFTMFATGRPDLVIYAREDDPFLDPNAAAQLHAFSYLAENEASTFLLDPTSHSYLGFDINSLMTSASFSGTPSSSLVPGSDPPLRRWVFPDIDPVIQQGLALVKGVGPSATYKLLTKDGVAEDELRSLPDTTRGFFAAHYAFGGALNKAALRLIQKEPSNPTRPLYDGFGYPLTWVPPTDPSLIGGSADASSVQLHLQNAHKSADAAVAAVTIAFNTLLEQQKTQLDVEAQKAKSTQVFNAAGRSLCGDAKPDCDIGSSKVDLLTSANRTKLATIAGQCINVNPQPGNVKLACTTYQILRNYDVNILIATPVFAELSKGFQPPFSDFAGGALQTLLIEQWAAYRRMNDQFNQVATAYQEAAARWAAADAAKSAVNAQARDNCSPDAMMAAVFAGMSVSAGFPGGGGVSMSLGPLVAQMQKCKDLKNQIQAADAEALLAFAQGVNVMAEETLRAADAGRAIQVNLAQVEQATLQTKLTKERAALDASLAASTNVTNSSLFRRYHDYDIWRARALVENARRYAVTARRAIEARFVVDLSTMNDAEPFVGAPGLWADQVYDYDLNMPSAVGLTLSGQQSTGSIYPNVVVDYVDNLERFVNGFVVKRPTAASGADTEVVSLPGPKGGIGGGSLPPGVIDSSAYKWLFYCGTSLGWVDLPSGGDPDLACGSNAHPTQARLRFALDAWGRIDGTIGSAPYESRYNERWERFALNVVGTGVLDCTKTSDPLTCYSQPFLRYDLSHTGPAWVTDYNQAWRTLGVGPASIEGAKALAAEQWLDPLANGFGKPYVDAVARRELTERPLGGVYQATFRFGPEVTLGRIERVQLLLSGKYWVKQK